MTRITLTGLAGGVALTFLAAALPAAAQDPCHQAQHNSGAAGALIGGAAGAVLGSNIAHHGGRTGGAIIGGVAGAALGNNIGRSSAQSSDACQYNYEQAPPPSGYYSPGPDPRYGYNGYYQQPYYSQPYAAPPPPPPRDDDDDDGY